MLFSSKWCRFGFSLALVLVVFCVPPDGRAEKLDQRELIRVEPFEREQLQALVDRGLDLWEMDGHSALLYASPEEKQWLQGQGFAFRSAHEPLSRRLADPRAVDGYLTFAEYEADMANWAADHPGLVQLTSIGTSHEGRNIWLLKISDNVALDEPEPAVLLISLQHAREWLSGMTLHGIVEHFISSYGTDAEVTNLLTAMELYVVLVANPDGYVYTHTTQRLWRKNRRDNGDGSFGVDLNRNFPYAWTNNGTSSSLTWGGPAPLSEPENQAIDNFLSANPVVGLLNYHTYGTRVMHNWAYTTTLPPNADLMGDLAYNMAQEIESVNGQTMRNGSWSITLDYVGGGATIDHVHANLGVPSLTLELRPVSEDGSGFAPPGSAIAPSISENIKGAIYFLQWIRTFATDATPPVISNLEVVKISNTEATIRWHTDEPATRRVNFGLSAAFGSHAQPDRLRGVKHEVRLTGLTPTTTYHYSAVAENLAGLETSSPAMVFNTTSIAMDITPPQYPAITILRRAAPGTVELQWQKLDSSPLTGFRLYTSADGSVWTLLYDTNALGPALRSYTFPDPAPGAITWYRMTAVDSATYQNESEPCDVYALRVDNDAAKVLVVDGFDRWNSMAIAQGKNHAFAAHHGRALSAAGVAFDSCANQAIGAGISLMDYQALVWVLGTEGSSSDAFSPAEQSAVGSYLAAGGNLFVSGSEIGWDLEQNGSTTDKAFFSNYLSADYINDDLNKFSVNGTGNALGAMQIRFDDGSRRIYRVESPDRISPLNGALTALQTSASEGAAVQRQGVFGAGVAPGRVLMLSFPFETIYPEQLQDDVMAAILQYFQLIPTAAVTDWALY